MEIEEIIRCLADAVGDRVTENMGVSFRAEPHRGTCAGSVLYRFKPNGSANEYDILQAVIAFYEMNGEAIDIFSAAGCRKFMTTLFNVCKTKVREGKKVNLANILVYEAQAYKDGRDAWMKPIAVNGDFNKLQAKVQLDKPTDKIKKAQRAAKRKPFDVKAKVESEGEGKRYIVCEACGHRNRI